MKSLKSFAKHTALVFAVLLSMYGCQKDDAVTLESNDSHHHEHSSTTKSVSASEIPKVIQFLESKSNNRLEFVIDDTNSELGMHRSHEENLSMTTALVDQIKMVTNSYGRSNYTFKLIEEETRAGVYFLNLIVKEHKDEFYVFIMKYVPSEAWLNTFTDTSSFSSYSGDIYFYDHNGVYAGKTTLVNGQTTSSDSREPCPPDIDHNSPTNTTNSSTTTVSTSTESATSSSSSTSSGSVGGLDDLTAGFGWLCNWRGQLHPSPNDCNNPGQGGTWTIQVDYGNEDRSMRDLTDCPRVSGECYQSNGDPCPNGCDEDGYCIDEQEEIESFEIDINVDIDIARYNNFYFNYLTSEQQAFLDAHSNIELAIQQFLSENGFTNMNENLVKNITHVLMNNENLTFNEVLDEMGVIPTILDENEDEFFEYIDGSQEELLSFDSIDELTSFINSIETDETSQEQVTYELEERRDELYYRISNYPDTELLVTVRLEEPESEDECMSILSVNTTLVGDESFYEWTQLDSSSEPFVIIDEPNNQVVVEIKGKLQIGINFSGNPFRITKIYTIRLVYNYSTSNLIIGGIYDIH